MRTLLPRCLGCLCLALLAAPLTPARAVVVQAEADTDGDLLAESASHQAAAGHRAVATVLVGGGAALGTGVYIGPSRDGRRGLVLTAAHLFGPIPAEPGPLAYDRVQVRFGADPETGHGRVKVAALRVLVHPGYQEAHRGRLSGALGHRRDRRPTIKDDLAVLEFDLEAHAGALEAWAIAPAPLDEPGAQRGLRGQAAEFVGFGSYGTNRELLFPGNRRAHLGRTLVSHGDFLGREVLLSLVPPAPEAKDPDGAAGPVRAADRLLRFGVRREPLEVYSRFSDGPLWLQSHPEQAVPAPGDSGGPLLVRGPDGTARVAGITSRRYRRRIRLGPGRWAGKDWALFHVWEPVGLHRAWIDRMRAGLVGGRTLLLEPGEESWRFAGAQDPDGCLSSCPIL